MSTPAPTESSCSASSASHGAVVSIVSSLPWSSSRVATGVTHKKPEDGIPEPGEIKSPKIKLEYGFGLSKVSGLKPPSSFTESRAMSSECNMNQATPNPFAQISQKATSASLCKPSGQQDSPVNPFAVVPRTMTTVQRRNQERLGEIVKRLENFNGSVTQLLAVAKVQQQIKAAFRDLDRARNQLKQILQQFERLGHMSKRQTQQQNKATRELSRASQELDDLFWELNQIQRRG
ncbi:hypothetical protein F5Y17DRAFT_308443 [Xylariaceae sp. FL0594]|nr:hypothetical protein F5Y17DRAFT_308443 [Xylariaceae sp. FL0594]